MIRIAMWSGPRNLSTAMMRSFGARRDTTCIDEPFYAAFLDKTCTDHPLREETLAAHERDPDVVASDLAFGTRDADVFYQKHMTHHMVPGVPKEWMGHVVNVFLIRHPARVLASYAKKRTAVTLDDIGFTQQTELFAYVTEALRQKAVVIDSDDILRAPKEALSLLCSEIGIPYADDMLSWKKGPRPEDGAWAPHWYDGVWQSTGFGEPPGPLPDVQGTLGDLCAKALPHYKKLKAQAIPVDCD
ncbi:MAG: HAD family hydrolase [Pseudomonadota bacterium]